jgi:hypothetical protein
VLYNIIPLELDSVLLKTSSYACADDAISFTNLSVFSNGSFYLVALVLPIK